MKIETILNAYGVSIIDLMSEHFSGNTNKRTRQYHAFRDRIIRLDERNKMLIATLEDWKRYAADLEQDHEMRY